MSASAIHRNILENMRDGVMSIDLNGRVTTFNRAAEEMLGLGCRDVIGRTLLETILELPGSDDFVQVILDAIYESSVTHHRRVTFPVGDRTVRLSVTTSFLFEGDGDAGERKGVVAVFGDITEVERLRDEVRDMAAFRVDQLVRAHRERGHVMAALDPLGQADRQRHPELDAAYYGISGEELDEAYAFQWGGKPVRWRLSQILDELRTVYCGSVGTQYMHIDDLEIQAWLRERLEGPAFKAPLPRDKQLRILRKLSDAEVFETFLQTEFSRAKRFSLEGGETLIPLLDQAIEKAADQGVTDVVVGMSHRGRLNVLANILGIDTGSLFRRFERFDSGDDTDCDGDVRFHLGVEAERACGNGREVRISLCFNPSHLEFVGPVVMGRARARGELGERAGEPEVLPLVVHGDAAFAGQGVVQEMLNLSRLDGYQTGGTVHVILNNQIGFTTQPWQSRSTQYPSDVARMLQVPVFHVNGEQPEAVDRVIGLALDFRKKWGRDVVVDMYCYRRRGHMELDDPSCTQPLLYQTIEQRPPIRETYTGNLLRLGNVSVEEANAIASESRLVLEQALASAEGTTESDPQPAPELSTAAAPDIRTAVSRERLTALLHDLGEVPDGFTPHPKIAALARRRQSIARGGKRIDWATGETLAYATLLGDGHSVRISGQDSERGTFAHRHAVLHDARTGARYVPLAAIGEQHDSRFSVQNSPLTETAVMGFEFGYSIEAQDDLVIWEAQFGDFANVAQVIIDQFVVSSQAKWCQPSGLVLFLPHGLEGQGPEHSSARPERFLQLCADGNIEVAYLSTASQVFHRLRHQVMSAKRRPLIAFTPKTMLQKPGAASSMDAFSNGAFRPVIADDKTTDPVRIVLCAGQLGAEIRAAREKTNSPVAVIRLEQLYPFPAGELAAVIEKYPNNVPVVWVQEEPENMGAWHWLRPRLEVVVENKPIDFVARPERASPATGSLAIHRREQRAILARALDMPPARTRRVPGSDGACLVTTENESGGG